jgi:dTDP-glucose 4,6-dehydratase
MKILVTGATGFVGEHRVNDLKTQGHDVVAIGSTHRQHLSNTEAYLDIAQKDSIEYLVARERPDRIEHFASVAIVAVSRTNPYETYRTNVLGAVSVLDTAKKYNVPVMMMITDKYYGSLSIAKENDRPEITSGAYETSKTLQDIVAQSYRTSGSNITIIRSCNIFGKNDRNSRIIPNTIRVLEKGEAPVIFSNILGIRQFIYIKDFLRALDTILEKDQGGIYNIGTDINLSQADVVMSILSIYNGIHHTEIYPAYKEGLDIKEIPEQYLDWTKLHKLGWEPKYNFDSAITEMIS